MHPDNAFYGHDLVLARHAGLADARLRGHIQHGWSTTHGFGASFRRVSWLPLLGWGERTRMEAEAAGVHGVTLIGAPFAYLARDVDPGRHRPRATIVYPFHGTERQGLTGSHARLADEIAERESRPVTVCLYWADHTPRAEAAYRRHGFAVTSHGHRRDPRFLERQMDLLLQHDRIVTNRVGSAFWYGCHLGLEAEIYGPYFGLDHLAGVDSRLRRFQQTQWPAFHAGPVAGSEAREIGSLELGAGFCREPDELAAILTRGGRARRAVEHRLARAEHGARRLLVNVLRRVPAWEAIDASPLPHALPEDAAVETVIERVDVV